MAAKKKRTTKKSPASTGVSRSRRSSRVRPHSVAFNIGRFGLPLLISGILVVALAVLGFTFYRSATTSDFFHVRSIEVRGNDRTPGEDIRRLVAAEVERTGIWNADLGDLRAKIEKFPYAKTASVSRVLPAGIRVDLVERVPAAVVKLSSGSYLVDADGTLLEKAGNNEHMFPFPLQGWDESKTEKAGPENLLRLKMYKKMLDEWKQFDLAARVKYVDLANMKEPIAVVEDSGRPISITVAKDNLGKSLKTAVEAVSGKGTKVKSVDAEGVSPVITYLEF